MHKKADLTAILVEQVSNSTWCIGRVPVAIAAHLDAKITKGANSPEQKARFIAQAHGLLRSILGNELPTATYVVVDEVDGDAWGYDGVTQNQRHRTIGSRILAGLRQLWRAQFVPSGWERPLP